MSPRTGRPKSADPKMLKVMVRITSEENQRLEEYCEAHDTNKAAVAREGIHMILEQDEQQTDKK